MEPEEALKWCSSSPSSRGQDVGGILAVQPKRGDATKRDQMRCFGQRSHAKQSGKRGKDAQG